MFVALDRIFRVLYAIHFYYFLICLEITAPVGCEATGMRASVRFVRGSPMLAGFPVCRELDVTCYVAIHQEIK